MQAKIDCFKQSLPNTSEPPKAKPSVYYYKESVIETKNYTASCSLMPNTNETIWYQWRKDRGDTGEETESGVLFIQSIKRTDAGSYTCRGRNVAGYSDSDPVTITVHCKFVYCDEIYLTTIKVNQK